MKSSVKNTDKLLVLFVIRVVISSVFSIILFSVLFSEIIYKFDLGLKAENLFSVIIIALSAILTVCFSLIKIKNNGALMGLISVIPLAFYSLINMIFNENTALFFLIKAVLLIIIGSLFGILRVNKNKKFKV